MGEEAEDTAEQSEAERQGNQEVSYYSRLESKKATANSEHQRARAETQAGNQLEKVQPSPAPSCPAYLAARCGCSRQRELAPPQNFVGIMFSHLLP